MKKKFLIVLTIMVVASSSCEQQVVSNTVPDGNYAVTADSGKTTDPDILVTELPVEDIEDITEEEAQTTSDEVTAVTKEQTGDEDDTDESDDSYSEEDEEYYEEEEEYEEPEYDYDPAEVAAKVKTLDKIADSIRDEISAFLVGSVFSGYGMTLGGEGTYMSIYIEDGLWTVSVDDTECFDYTEEMEWFGYGEADSTTEKADAEDPDTLLAIALVKKFPEIKNGSVGAWLQGGSCKAAYFTEDTTAGDGQMDFLLGDGGWTEKTCEWDGYNQGMSDEGNIVGTSPVLKFAVEE